MGKYTDANCIKLLYKEVETAKLTDQDMEFYIGFAEAEVDGRLAKRYALPLTEVPAIIKDVSTELALIKIIDRFFTSQAQDENEQRNVRKDELDELLAGISSGTLCLVNSDGIVLAAVEGLVGITSDTSKYTPTFGVGEAINEEVDPDRVEDENDDRL